MANLVDEGRIGAVWMLLAIAGGAACASDDSGEGAPPAGTTEVDPVTPPPANPRVPVVPLSSCDQPLDAYGVAFVGVFFAVSDYCPARTMGPNLASTTQLQMIRDDAGRTCLHGRINDGWARLILGFDGSNRNGSMPLPPESKPLDADSAGIDGVQFTLDTPPAGGLTLETAYVVGEGCFPGRCELHNGFYITEPNGLARSFDRSGSYSFRFSDFQQAPGGNPEDNLDMTHLAGMFFHVGTGDFDFCLSDFHFLDLTGAPVR
jgi:hypothetical protein